MIGTNCVSCYGCKRRLILVGGYVRRCWQSNCKHKCAFVSLIITHHFIANTINGWKHVNKESSCVCRSIWVQPEVREGGGAFVRNIFNQLKIVWMNHFHKCILCTHLTERSKLNSNIYSDKAREGGWVWETWARRGGGGGEPKSDELTIYISSSKLNCNLLWCMLS